MLKVNFCLPLAAAVVVGLLAAVPAGAKATHIAAPHRSVSHSVHRPTNAGITVAAKRKPAPVGVVHNTCSTKTCETKKAKRDRAAAL
ncbi:MAG TPA: hypothetical protein VHY80_09165 [Stellaceae bacterium]|jgi:hypothetical protein|nr:hypothetical protein [Stellaceae bacterium]